MNRSSTLLDLTLIVFVKIDATRPEGIIAMYYDWKPYVPVAERKANAKLQMHRLAKKGTPIQPVEIEGRKITKTFWGNLWSEHIENMRDYENRLPRGRTYVRNGSVCHLEIRQGQISAFVSGSSMYKVEITVATVPAKKWQSFKQTCQGHIGSIVELLSGKLSDEIMKQVVDADNGLFPRQDEIKLNCSCPDWATMCKHVAAVLYGVGARLDSAPENLFVLRGVDYKELIDSSLRIKPNSTGRKVVANISEVFNIELDEDVEIVVPKKSEKIKIELKKIATSKTPPRKPEFDISRGIRASHIKRLRKKLDLTEPEFAQIVGRSVATIRGWESKRGVLVFHAGSKAALTKVFGMSKAQAKRQLKK